MTGVIRVMERGDEGAERPFHTANVSVAMRSASRILRSTRRSKSELLGSELQLPAADFAVREVAFVVWGWADIFLG
jgi:hypothetical protein